MSAAHAQELERIESLIEAIRYNSSRGKHAVSDVISHALDLDRLTTIYIRLAIAYRERSSLQQTISRELLVAKISSLEDEIARATTPEMERLLQRRLSIVRQRLEHWERTERNLRMISEQMATINDIVRLLHSATVSPMGSEVTSEELDGFMAELEQSEAVLEEVYDLEQEAHGQEALPPAAAAAA
jgi:hypothetical protein